MGLTRVSGDIFDPGIVVAGVVTATAFHGPFSGSDGVFTGIITAAGIKVGGAVTITSSGIDCSAGIGTFFDLYVTNNVSIGGTLIYEDVVNVDSVGIITARAGVHIDDSITHIGDTNTKIRFPEADNFTVECAGNERFRVKPTNDVAVFTGSNSGTLTIRNDTANEMQIHSGSSDALILGSGGENERVRITSTGLFGVGVTPISIFHVRPLDETNFLVRNEGSTVVLASETNNGRDNNRGMALEATQFEFIEGGSEKVRIDSSGRLLIGTTTEGNSVADDLTIAGSGDSGITIRSGTSSEGSLMFSDATSGSAEHAGWICYNHNSNFLRFFTNATERLRITSAGNLGINQTSPNARIEITDTSTAQIRVGYNQTKYARIGRNSSGHYEFFSQENGSPLVFGTAESSDGGGAEKMRIDRYGRLLVGTTASRAVNSAQGSLQIEGTGAEDSDMSIVRNQNNSGGPAICFGKSRSGSLGGNTAVQSGDQFGSLIFMGNDGTDLASQGARIDALCDGTPGGNDMPGRLTFSTTADNEAAATERMRIDSGGSVSIGDAATHTFSAHSEGDDLVVGGSGWRGMTIYGEGGGGVIQFADNADNRVGQILYDHGNNQMDFRVSGNQTRLRIDSVGRHGINVTNTGDYYSAADDLIIRETNGGDSGLTIRTGTGNSGLICFADGASSTSDQYRRGQIRYHHNTDIMDFTTAGNTAKLQIKDTGEVQITTRNSANSGDHGFRFGSFGIRSEDTGGFNWWRIDRNFGGWNTFLSLRADGNVGINCTNPGQLLEINGASNPCVLVKDTTNDCISYMFSQDSVATFGSASSHDVVFNVSNGEKARITTAGRVGIGEDSPDGMLHIKGTQPNFFLEDTSGTHGQSIIEQNDDNLKIRCDAGNASSGSGSNIQFHVDSLEKVRITSGGNIGLNGMNPGSSDETVAIQEPSGGSVAAVTLSHLSGGNRHGCKFETISGANQGVRLSSRFNSTYTERFTIDGSTTTIREDTNKNIRFTGGIGEIGNVTGFQATNDANSALTDFGIRATTLRFATGSSERMRIDASGNVGINELTPDFSGFGGNGGGIELDDVNSGFTAIKLSHGGNDMYMAASSGGGYIATRTNSMISIETNSVERMNFSNGGNVRIRGETALTGTTGDANGLDLHTGGGTSIPIYFGSEQHSAQKSIYLNGYWMYYRGHVNEGHQLIFSQSAGNAPHSNKYVFKYNECTRPGGGTGWNSGSDQRAKENVQTITNGIAQIKQLRPVTFDWTDDYADAMGMYAMDKSDPNSYNWVSKKENGYDNDMKNGKYGFIAQEFGTVFPKDITKKKMKVGDTDINDFQSLTHDSLIPTLTAALKEAIAKIETLETKVAALESS